MHVDDALGHEYNVVVNHCQEAVNCFFVMSISELVKQKHAQRPNQFEQQAGVWLTSIQAHLRQGIEVNQIKDKDSHNHGEEAFNPSLATKQ